jgi:signal transduction histidine kinase
VRVEAIDGLVPRPVEVGLFRILQESVSNMIKHSLATDAEVALVRESGALVLTVKDNGKGFVAEPEESRVSKQPRGFGLVGIGERARMLGGTAKITSAPGHGTRVDVRIPIDHAADAGRERS